MAKPNENAEVVLQQRYYQPGEDWEKLCRRVADFIDIDGHYKNEYFELMHDLCFLPNTPTLMNAGTQLKLLSACFVLPVHDSLDEIYKAIHTTAMIHAEGGGTGFDFSELRPKGARVSRTNSSTSGPVSFIRVFDRSADVIKQGGKRRGANMGVVRIDHLDVEEFIHCKEQEGDVSNFNLSVALTDAFMHAVENDLLFVQDYNTHDLPPREVYARDLFEQIVEGAWRNGEPGVLFLDTINNNSNIDEWMAGVNPCGEVPKPPYGSCNLGSLNLAHDALCQSGEIDYDTLVLWSRLAVRFLDSVVEQNEYPDPEIDRVSRKYRSIGLGVMGFADLLLRLGIEYGSAASLTIADEVMNTITAAARIESEVLLRERGPNNEERSSEQARRNAELFAQAPTGTLSLIAGVSSAIEPNFNWQYESHRADHVFKHYHPMAKKYLENDEELPFYFVTALQVPFTQHIAMQAQFQKHIDQAVSKTINMTNDATRDDVRQAILMAWKSGCKGLTVYRDGSRKEQVLVTTKEAIAGGPKTTPIKRYETLPGFTTRVEIGEKRFYTTVNYLDESPIEVIVHSRQDPECDETGRLVSLLLRSNVSIDEVLEQLDRSDSDRGAAIARALRKAEERQNSIKCPECGAVAYASSGCFECSTCGWALCSTAT